MKLKVLVVGMLACFLSQMFGCASSRLVDIWHDPSFQAPPLGKILVIAVRKDAAKRRIWEDAFTGDLAKYGVAATSSYTMFPDAPPDTNQVVATVQASSFDGVLVILRLPTETTKQYVQGYTSTERNYRYNSYYSSYWPRYWTHYREIEHPGYVDSQKVDIRAIDVTTTRNGGRLVWSAISRTPDPGTVMDVQRGIVSLVISDLARRRIINAER